MNKLKRKNNMNKEIKKERKLAVRIFAGVIAALLVSANLMPLASLAAESDKCNCEEHCHKDGINYKCPVCAEDYTKCSIKDSAGNGNDTDSADEDGYSSPDSNVNEPTEGKDSQNPEEPTEVTTSSDPDDPTSQEHIDEIKKHVSIPDDLSGRDKAGNKPNRELEKWHSVSIEDVVPQKTSDTAYKWHCFSYFGQTRKGAYIDPPLYMREIHYGGVFEAYGEKSGHANAQNWGGKKDRSH